MWHRSVEQLLSKYCDESQVREAMHRRAYQWYKSTLTWFQLPIIIMSAASGSVQFLSKGFPLIESYIITGTGTLSILVTIVSSVMTYLKLGETKTKHETAQIAWQRFHNEIAHELAVHTDFRTPADEFLEHVKNSYERLFEISPPVANKFVITVRKKINKTATHKFQVPFYMNGYKHQTVWKPEDDLKSEEFVDNSINEV